MLRSDFIEKYSVKIAYGSFGYDGSGVLVKAKSNYYLLTAKHNFKKNKREIHKDIKTQKIDLDLINVTSKNNQNIKVKECVYDYDDLIVFLISGSFQDFDDIQILKGMPTNKMDYFFYGYPNHKPKGHFINKLCSRYKESNTVFTIRNQDNNKTAYIEGFSGSGIFTEDEHDVYSLCGIVLQSDDSYYTINSFNLSEVINEINNRLEKKELSPLVVKNSNFDVKEIYGMYDWVINNHDNFLVEKVKKIFGEEHKYDNLIEPSDELKRLNKYMNSTNEFEILEDIYTEKLADIYLLGAFIASKYQDKEKALIYLEKAIKFRTEYIIFLSEIDKENSKIRLFEAGKIAYIEKNYDHAYNCFQKILSLKLNKLEKIDVYEYLIRIVKNMSQEKKERIDYYLELLYLYDDDFEKATVYYELSLLETKEQSKYYVTQGIRLVEFSNYLEIKYLLYKRLYELTEDKKVYLLLESALEKLVKFKVEYKYELSTLRYGDTLSTIAIGSYISILILLLLIISFGYMQKIPYINSLTSFIAILLFTGISFFKLKLTKRLFWINLILFIGSFIFFISSEKITLTHSNPSSGRMNLIAQGG